MNVKFIPIFRNYIILHLLGKCQATFASYYKVSCRKVALPIGGTTYHLRSCWLKVRPKAPLYTREPSLAKAYNGSQSHGSLGQN